MKTYNWATYGTGVIANQLAQTMASQGRKLYSVSNRTYAKGVAFAEKYNISKIYDNPEDVFTDENVDIIYISTPHNTIPIFPCCSRLWQTGSMYSARNPSH